MSVRQIPLRTHLPIPMKFTSMIIVCYLPFYSTARRPPWQSESSHNIIQGSMSRPLVQWPSYFTLSKRLLSINSIFSLFPSENFLLTVGSPTASATPCSRGKTVRGRYHVKIPRVRVYWRTLEQENGNQVRISVKVSIIKSNAGQRKMSISLW